MARPIPLFGGNGRQPGTSQDLAARMRERDDPRTKPAASGRQPAHYQSRRVAPRVGQLPGAIEARARASSLPLISGGAPSPCDAPAGDLVASQSASASATSINFFGPWTGIGPPRVVVRRWTETRLMPRWRADAARVTSDMGAQTGPPPRPGDASRR